MQNSNKGFTLTELLITIAIIGILAAITLPRYFQTEAARVSEATSMLSMIRLAEESFQDQNGCYALVGSSGTSCPTLGATWNALGIEIPANNYFDYEIEAASDTTFCASATRNGTGSPPEEYEGTTICIDETGAFYGDHPNGPSIGSASTGGCNTFC